MLVTGFEPFGGDAENPSAQLAQALDGRVIAGARVVGAVLPCVFGASRRALITLVRRHRPRLVLAVGQAGGREAITPERVAINLDDARIPDNAGAQPLDRPIVRGGPAAYFSTLPVKAIVAALHGAGLPAAVSHTAGTFVCNHVFYALMHELRRRPARGRAGARGQEEVRGGFIHVPFVTTQRALHPRAPALPLAKMQEALELAIAVALRTRRDARERGGATH